MLKYPNTEQKLPADLSLLRYNLRERHNIVPKMKAVSTLFSLLHMFNIGVGPGSGTGRVRLIRSHSSARFSFELSGNLNDRLFFNSNFCQKL